jgi:hypothetical protein
MKLRVHNQFAAWVKITAMKRYFFILPVLLISLNTFSQTSHASNAFLELGGNGGFLSLNYDRRFSEGNNGFGGRIGLGLGGGEAGHSGIGAVPTLPIGVNYLLGKGQHHLEAGAGVTIGTSDFGFADDESSVYFVPSLGYRFQSHGRSGFLFRLTATPPIGSNTPFWAGLSFGVRF